MTHRILLVLSLVTSATPLGKDGGIVKYGGGPLLEIGTADRSRGNLDYCGGLSYPLVGTRGRALQSVSCASDVRLTWLDGTSQTLLYSLLCLGLIPIAVARWGELAGTETAGYLEDHYQLSYSEGRAEQFPLCCVATSGGLSEAQTENRICKWTHYKKQKQKDLDNGDPGNHHKAAFRDAIFPNQNLYHPVDNKLCIILGTGKRIVNPPADKWHNPRINKRPTQTVFWDQHTRATNKRILGRNHFSKAKSEKIVTLSLNKVLKFFPTRLEIVLQEYNVPLELSINNLLAAVIGEPDPVPNERIIAKERCRKPGFFFAMKTVNDKIRWLKGANLLFEIARECRNKGGFRFALVTNLSATSA
jgi:hypothetical protein